MKPLIAIPIGDVPSVGMVCVAILLTLDAAVYALKIFLMQQDVLL